MTAQKRRGRLNELDALRGIGALLVVNFHYTLRFHELFPKAPHVRFVIGGGDYRVLLFFAISGFAIFFSMARLASAGDFLVNRAARLMPAYWAAMILTLVIEHLGHASQLYVSPFAAMVNVTMLQGFFFLPAVDGAYWTLTVEIAFYISMLALWLACRLRNIERLILGWLALRLIFVLLWPDMPERVVMVLVLRYIPYFAIGMVTYRVWAGERSWRQQAPILTAILATVSLCDSWDFLLIAALIITAFWAMVERRLGWICLPPLLWVGRISYSLYLVHQHIGFTIMLNAGAAGLDPMIGYTLAILAAFLLGTLVNRFVERPASRCLLDLWTRRRTRAVTLSTSG